MMTLVACGNETRSPDTAEATPPHAPAAAKQVVVAVDLSGSLTDQERTSNRNLLSILAGSMTYGERLVLVQAHAKGVRDDAVVNPIEMPVARNPARPLERDRRALAMAHQTADIYIGKLFQRPPANGTDLIATLHTAAERVRDGGGRQTTLVVLSDMLQCTRDFCMERTGVVPDSEWILAQKGQGLMPDLSGVCVSVVGADATTPQGVRVREFWESYFQAAGADLTRERYFHKTSNPALLSCA
jgi:hypothetical protein